MGFEAFSGSVAGEMDFLGDVGVFEDAVWSLVLHSELVGVAGGVHLGGREGPYVGFGVPFGTSYCPRGISVKISNRQARHLPLAAI